MNIVFFACKKASMPSKKKSRVARSRVGSENLSDGDKAPPKKPRRRKTIEDGTKWIDDDTLGTPKSDSESDSTYVPSESEIDEEFIGYLLRKHTVMPVEELFPPEKKVKKEVKLPLKLSKSEELFYNRQSPAAKKELLELMSRVSSLVLDELSLIHI